MPTLGDKLTKLYLSLKPPASLPNDITSLYPFADPQVRKLVRQFFKKFYPDTGSRRLLLGINPGRFGAGITGINFTAPRQLQNNCGIDHPLGNHSELSAEFIYEMIEGYGGPAKFYGDYFIGAISPIGFIKNGVNMNYYDDKKLATALEPFIVSGIRQLLAMGFKNDKCFCIGGDKNFSFLSQLNEEHQFFNEIIPLPHPRFVMQYRRKQKETYIGKYLDVLKY